MLFFVAKYASVLFKSLFATLYLAWKEMQWDVKGKVRGWVNVTWNEMCSGKNAVFRFVCEYPSCAIKPNLKVCQHPSWPL